MKLISINRKTGMRAGEGEGGTIVEAFKPGTGPADSYWVIGMEGEGTTTGEISSEARKAVTESPGGLY
jgi:penicillin-binding protein 1A